MRLSIRKYRCVLLAIVFVFCVTTGLSVPPRFLFEQALAAETTYIVQATSTDVATAAVEQAGGEVTRHLSIINGVSATLDATALA